MKYSCTRRRAGQSLPLFALMMVFLIGMVGLSVDVGNAYSQERRIQSIVNSAALTGMNTVISAPFGTRVSNQQVWQAIQRAAAGNRVDNSGDDYAYYVDYIVSGGQRIRLADWNGHTANVAPGLAPDNIVRMQVTMEHRVPAYFTPVVGWDDFNVNVEGSACLGGYGLGILSMGVPQTLVPEKDGQPYHVIEDADGNIVAPGTAPWSDWSLMYGMKIRFPIANNTSNVPGTLIPWLSWNGSNGNPVLKAGMSYPGTLHEGFKEATPGNMNLLNTAPLEKLTLGDWVNGDTGKRSGVVNSEFRQLKDDGTIFALPIYDQAGSGQTSFHIIRIGKFRMIDYDGGGSDAFMQLEYLGDKNYAVTECVAPLPPNQTYPLTGQAQFSEVYSRRPTNNKPTTYDIVIVMDLSESMKWDWNDRWSFQSGFSGARLNDARTAIANIVRGYDVEADPDARMALVTFNNNSADLRVGLTTNGCPEPTLEEPDRKCTDDEKWEDIQDAAATLNASGATPGPLAFEVVRDLLQNNKRSVPSDKHYGQVVIFATDGVFNVCGAYTEVIPGINPCPAGQPVPIPSPLPAGATELSYYNNAEYNQMPGHPIWQAQAIARQIKATGARIFTVALKAQCDPNVPTCFNPAGLADMSSGSGYSYQANDPASMATIYEHIMEKISVETAGCVPFNLPLRPAPYATIKLTQPQNPTWHRETTADANGNWNFNALTAGLYAVTVEPSFQFTSPTDGVRRSYPRVVNARNPNEEDKATIDINGKRPDGATFVNDLNLFIGNDDDGVPRNGCSDYKAP